MRRRRPRELKVKWNPERKIYEPVLLERHVVREIVDRLWLQAKIKVWVINQPVHGKTPQNEAGLPDLQGYIPRHVLAHADGWLSPGQGITEAQTFAVPLYIEVKRPGGVRSEAQKRFILEAKQGGCVAFFAESWLDVVRELQMVGIALKI